MQFWFEISSVTRHTKVNIYGVSIPIIIVGYNLNIMLQSVCLGTNIVIQLRVKSGKFGHQVNSDTHLQTV